jgi:hypothetical protein
VLHSKGLSFEVRDAASELTPVKSRTEGLSRDEAYMLSWLRRWAHVITEAESEFQVDRRAIAGAIAWEALLNPKDISVRAVGPGKIHDRLVFHSVCDEVEARGLIHPPRGHSRLDYIATAEGAIRYIAAIMSAGAEVAAKYGHHIRRSPAILAHFFNIDTLESWDKHLKAKPAGQKLVPSGDYGAMDGWVAVHNDFLVDAVSKPQIPEEPPAP